jgi:hypothetical protein
MRSIKNASLSIVFLSFLSVLGCDIPKRGPTVQPTPTPETQTGKVTGVAGSVSASEATAGKISNMADMQLIITKANGKEIRALCPKDILEKLRGGQLVEIEKMKDTDKWMVTKILSAP